MRNVNEATDVEVRHIVHDLLVGRVSVAVKLP